MKKISYAAMLVLLVASASAFEWFHADQHDFEIVTVTDDAGVSRDYVSNGESWFECNEGLVEKGISPPAGPEFGYEHTSKSAKFLCTRRDNDYTFLECCSDGPLDGRRCEENNDASKQIAPGGASTILVRDQKMTFTQSDALVLIAGTDFHITDWTAYSHLAVAFTVSGQPQFTVVLVDSGGHAVFSAMLTDYVVNTPLLGKPMYAQVPLPPLADVQKILFRYTSPAVPGLAESSEISIDQAYLVSSTNAVAFCSNAKYLDRSVESSWLLDLDANNLDGSIPPEPAGKSACNAIPGFNWTGTRCCGDDNIQGFTEYFNDTMGSCWNGNPLFTNESAMDVVLITSKNGVQKNFTYYCPRANCTYPAPPGFPYTSEKSPADNFALYFIPRSTQIPVQIQGQFTIPEAGLIEARQVAQQVIMEDGRLYSCNPSPHISARNYERVIPLTTASSSCSVLGNYFCSPELGWNNASISYEGATVDATERTILKDAGALGIQSSSCCSADTCWNGEFCVSDQSATADPNNAEVYSNQRCVAGSWAFTPLVFSWDKRNFGYCPTSSQCLVDIDGNPEFNNNPSAFFDGNKPLCINDSQFIMDNYCAASNWTTRTRLIALELLNLVEQAGNPSNYTLFCDDYSKALVDTQYGTVLESILGPTFSQFGTRNCFTETQEAVPCVNNFCVLDYSTPSGTKKVLGVSLNKAVHDPRSGFLAGLGLPSGYCASLQGTGLFGKCSNDNKVWYSPEINATIYSKEGVELYQQTTGIVSWFRNLFTGIISWFTGSQSPATGPDYGFITNSSSFSKLYIAPRPLDLSTQSTRAVQGFQESIGDNQFLLVKYTNFPANLCTYVQNKAQVSSFGSSLQLSNLVCVSQGNETLVFTHDPAAMNLWQDLTSKLRVS